MRKTLAGATCGRRAGLVDLAADLASGLPSLLPAGIVDVDGLACFTVTSEDGARRELARSDATTSGTRSARR